MCSHTNDLLLLIKRLKNKNEKTSTFCSLLLQNINNLHCVFGLRVITKDTLKKTATEITEASLFGPLVQEQAFSWPLE